MHIQGFKVARLEKVVEVFEMVYFSAWAGNLAALEPR